MAAQDKTVKITIVVDEQSAEKAKNAIIGIKTEVDRLVKSVEQLGGFFGNLKVGTQAGSPGTSSGTQTSHSPGGGASGGIQQALSFGAVQGGKDIEKTTGAMKEHVKSMKDQFKSLTEAQDQMVRKSQGLWEKFWRAVRGSSTGGGGPQSTAPQPGTAAAGGGGAAGGGKGAGGNRGLLSSVGSAMGIPGWAMGTAGAVGFAAGAVGTMYQAWGSQMQAQNRFELAQPMMASGVQAQFGGMMGQNAVSIRHGDLARSWAIGQVRKTSAHDEVISEGYKKKIQEGIKLEAPVGMMEAAKTGRIGALWDNFKARVGAGVSVAVKHPLDSLKELGATAVDLSPIGALAGRKRLGMKENYLGNVTDVISEDVVKRREAEASHAADQARARQALITNYMASKPQMMADLNEMYGGALGDQGLARAGGVSGGFRFNKRTGKWSDSLSDFEEGARNMGISGGERAGLQQQMGAQAGRGFFYNGASLLSPQAGGLSNAAGIFGVGAQFGGGGGFGDAKSFMGGIQSKIGRGGLDVTAGVGITNYGMGQMTSGRFQANSGSGYMSALIDASSGGSTGRDMRMSREAAGGFAHLDQGVFGGGMDPLQKALNYSTAMEVAGHLPWSTQKALAGMDAATIAEVMRNPNSAEANALKSKGVTADLLRDYFKSSTSRTFTRVTADMLTGSQQQAMASFKSAGGSTSYMKGMVTNLENAKKVKDPKKRRQAIAAAQGALDQGISDLASIFELDRGLSAGDARGTVRGLMAMEGMGGVTGKGAHRADSMKTVRGKMVKKAGQFVGDKGKRLAMLEQGKNPDGSVILGSDGKPLSPGAISERVAAMTDEANKEEAAASAANKSAGGGDLNATIDQLGDILRKFVGQLHGAGGGAAGPPG